MKLSWKFGIKVVKFGIRVVIAVMLYHQEAIIVGQPLNYEQFIKKSCDVRPP